MNVTIEGTPHTMELDIGSPVTIMSEEEFQRKWPKVMLGPCKKNLHTYLMNKIEVAGEAKVKVQYKNQTKYLPLVVVKGNGTSLFGRSWLYAIKLDWRDIKSQVNRVNNVKNGSSIDKRLAEIKNKYSDVFKKDMSTMKGIKATLEVKPDAKPKFYKARPVAYALRPKVSEEIQRLEEAGVLEKVQYSEWASPVVPVQKPDGSIRLCGDFKVTINPELEVPEYPFPTVEDIFTKLNGGQKFTKLDLSQAYQQIELDEGSREIGRASCRERV